MNTRRTTLLIAIILAIGTGWLTLNLHLGRALQTTTVSRVRCSSPRRYPGAHHITAAIFHTEIRRSASQPDAISDPAEADRLAGIGHDSGRLAD